MVARRLGQNHRPPSAGAEPDYQWSQGGYAADRARARRGVRYRGRILGQPRGAISLVAGGQAGSGDCQTGGGGLAPSQARGLTSEGAGGEPAGDEEVGGVGVTHQSQPAKISHTIEVACDEDIPSTV